MQAFHFTSSETGEGLEIEGSNNSEVGIRQPIMGYFKNDTREIFSPKITVYADKAEKLPINLRWGNSEDADGIAIPLHLKKNRISVK